MKVPMTACNFTLVQFPSPSYNVRYSCCSLSNTRLCALHHALFRLLSFLPLFHNLSNQNGVVRTTVSALGVNEFKQYGDALSGIRVRPSPSYKHSCTSRRNGQNSSSPQHEGPPRGTCAHIS